MDLLAHGIGGGSDLPIPASMAIAGGTAALTLSFVVLLVAWKQPRFATGRYGRPTPHLFARVVDGCVFAALLRLSGLTFACFLLWPALAGPDELTNPVFGVIYVWLWVGLVPFSLLLGRWYRAVSPVRTIALVLARVIGPDGGWGSRPYPVRWGYWPAAIGVLAFVWLELASPGSTSLDAIRLWFALYLAAMLVGSAIFGEQWLARADPFEVYSTLVAHLSPWGRREDGALVLVSPMRHLSRLSPEPGLVAVVAVLLGSTAYDSWRESTVWIRFVQSSTVPGAWLNTAMLLAWVVVVGLVFVLATRLTHTGQGPHPRRELPARLAHSIVPIIVGYMIAHYLSYFVESGQLALAYVSDPMGTGGDLFRTAGWETRYWLSQNPTLLASTKVIAIVVGHVLGVIAAHDRSLELLPPRSRTSGQLPLLFAMVLYTFMGLYLLFGT